MFYLPFKVGNSFVGKNITFLKILIFHTIKVVCTLPWTAVCFEHELVFIIALGNHDGINHHHSPSENLIDVGN